jgi:hypothetical protein
MYKKEQTVQTVHTLIVIIFVMDLLITWEFI